MVLRKISGFINYHYKRGCFYKKKYNLLSAWFISLKYNKNKKISVKPYKCIYHNHYHVGHLKKKTIKKIKYIQRVYRMSLLLINKGD